MYIATYHINKYFIDTIYLIICFYDFKSHIVINTFFWRWNPILLIAQKWNKMKMNAYCRYFIFNYLNKCDSLVFCIFFSFEDKIEHYNQIVIGLLLGKEILTNFNKSLDIWYGEIKIYNFILIYNMQFLIES